MEQMEGGTWHTHTCLNRMSNMKLLLAILSSPSLYLHMHMPVVWTNDVAKSASGSVLLCIPRYPPMLAFSTAPPTPGSPVEPWPFTTLLSASHSSHTAQERPPSLTASAHWPPACSLGPQTPPLWGLSWPSHQIHPFCGLLQQFPPFSRSWETRYSQEMPWWENEQTLSFWFYFLDLGNDIVSSPILPFPDNQAENR